MRKSQWSVYLLICLFCDLLVQKKKERTSAERCVADNKTHKGGFLQNKIYRCVEPEKNTQETQKLMGRTINMSTFKQMSRQSYVF